MSKTETNPTLPLIRGCNYVQDGNYLQDSNYNQAFWATAAVVPPPVDRYIPSIFPPALEEKWDNSLLLAEKLDKWTSMLFYIVRYDSVHSVIVLFHHHGSGGSCVASGDYVSVAQHNTRRTFSQSNRSGMIIS